MAGSSRVIVTRRLPDAVEAELRATYGATLNPDDHQFTAVELAAALRDYDVVLCTLTDPLTRAVFDAAKPVRARLLANFGVGFNHIDLAAARDLGLVVTNTPGVLTEDTADHTLLLMLDVARRVSEGERELRAGRWSGWRPTHMLGTRVSGKTLGIVGFGRIGQAVAARAHHGFGMRVLYHSRRRADAALEQSVGATMTDLVPLLRSSDFVTLHTPATAETRHLMSDESLSQMQRHAFLINTSRGDVIDEPALLTALDDGVIAGAALDVFDGEPGIRSGLLNRDNVVLVPHLGSATVESRVAMGQRALANIASFLAGEVPPDRVA
jgi:lactate dehydrogenase-like 2-hydroxyacid dehydrogenase